MSKNQDVAVEFWKSIAFGAAAGALGTVLMTLSEKLEQRFTGRPNSYVPAHTMERILGLREKPDRKRTARNLSMHFFNGISSGMIRGLMARAGVRGPVGSAIFWGVRLSLDQLQENATAVGAPPWSWPADEQAVDLGQKAVFALVTGALADRWVAPVDRAAHPEIRRHIIRQSPSLLRKAA